MKSRAYASYDDYMPARRVKSLHHNLQEGENVIFHREHRSMRNRSATKKGALQQYQRSWRRKWKKVLAAEDFLENAGKKKRKKKRY